MRFFHLTRGQRGVCGTYNTRLDCQSQPGSPTPLPAYLPSCLFPMTSYACSMPQKVGFTARHAPPRNSLCHKNRAHCACIVHLSWSQEPGVSQSAIGYIRPAKQQRRRRRRQTAKRAANSIRVPPLFTAYPLPAHV